MKLSVGDKNELQDNLDELLGAVRELKHELDRDNQEIESGNKRKRATTTVSPITKRTKPTIVAITKR